MENNQNQQVRKDKTMKDLIKIYGLGFCLAGLIMVVAYQFVAPAPPKIITIATASKTGGYYSFAKQYREFFAKEKIELKIIETSGSVENLRLLADHRVEVAFLQGGIATQQQYPDLEGLASLYLEPLWIFVRREGQISRLPDLAGKRVAIGPEGSGTRQIAMQLFNDNKLAEGGALQISPLGGMKGAKALLTGDIDALFMVTRVTSELVQQLALNPELELVNLERAEAYARLHHHLSHIVLPEGVLDMAANIPGQDVHLIAPAATLVTNGDLHPALTDLLMQGITSVHKKGTILTSGKTFPAAEKLDFPLSKEAERFYRFGPPFLQRYLPFWAASLIDRLKVMALPLIALILPLSKLLPPTYRWRMRSRIYRWYDELHQLDQHTAEDSEPRVIQEAIGSLDHMEYEVRQVEVPLSYSEELYNLRLHIEMLRNRFLRLLAAVKTGN